MNPILIVILVVVALAVIAAIAFGLYKAGFTVDKLKVKLGLVEAEASRKKSATKEEKVPTAGPQIEQQAEEGGAIRRSGITTPADAAAKVKQRAKGEKSKIDDSPIKIT